MVVVFFQKKILAQTGFIISLLSVLIGTFFFNLFLVFLKEGLDFGIDFYLHIDWSYRLWLLFMELVLNTGVFLIGYYGFKKISHQIKFFRKY